MSADRPNRPLRDRAVAAWWAALAVLLLVAAQIYIWNRLPVVDAVLFTGLGIVAFWRALRLVPLVPSLVWQERDAQPGGAPPAAAESTLQTPGWRWTARATVMAVAGVVCAALGALAALGAGLPPAQVFVAGASVAWLGLGAQLSGGTRPAGRRMLASLRAGLSRDGPWLVLLIALAASVRVVGLEVLPPGLWFDEAAIGLEAQRILQDSNYRPMYAQSTTSPAAFVYLVAAAEAIFGQTVAALRLVPALSGVLTTLLASATARLLWGGYAGLATGLLFAIARWDINFSRIGMQGATTPALLLAVFASACLAVRTRHPAAWAALGVCSGWLLWFYAANIFFLPVLLVGLVAAVVARTDLRLARPGMFLAVGGALLVAAPVLVDAAAHPDVVFSRPETVSVFRDADLTQALSAVRESLARHLAMFHFQGDHNGRHNLPGAPMLDPVTGILMLLGLTAALYHLHEPVLAALVAWLFFLLLPGVLSLPFEAPQGLRAIGALPAVLLLAGFGLQRLWGLWAPRMGRRPAGLILASALVLAAAFNLHTYFVVQAADPRVWNDFSMPATIIGRHLSDRGAHPGETLVSVFHTNHPTIQFLGGGDPDLLDPQLHLPLAGIADTTIFMAAPEEEAVLRMVETYYPEAACTPLRHSAAAPPVLYRCHVPAALARAVQGLGRPAQDEVRGTLHAPVHGPYRLGMETSVPIEWTLNGQPLAWDRGTPTDLLLPQGLHEIVIRRARQGLDGTPLAPRLLWQAPGGEWEPVPGRRLFHEPVRPVGLAATYYRGAGWAGSPALQRMEPGAFIYYHLPPLPFPFSVEWTGLLHIPSGGQYGFSVETISEASVDIDGQRVVASARPNATVEAHLPLAAGWHNLRVRHHAGAGYAHVFVRWLPPGGRWELIPPARLRPW